MLTLLHRQEREGHTEWPASDLEFRYRFWIFGALFCLAFTTYSIDHQNTGAALTEWIAALRGTTATAMDYRLTFAFAALFCAAAALIRTWAAPSEPYVVLY